MRKKNLYASSYAHSFTLFLASLSLIAFSFSARATDIDPFQLDTAHWASFDHYNDKVKRGQTQTDESPAPARESAKDSAAVSLPTLTSPSDPSAVAMKAATVPTPLLPPILSPTPAIASPSRPLDLPIMPGVNKGYQMRVNTTEDENVRSVPHLTNMDTNPTVQLSKHDWQDAAEAAQHNAQVNKDGDGNDEPSEPLHVRMTHLPNLQVKPQPPPQPSTNHGRAPPQATALSTPVPDMPKKSPAELAAVAAIGAYKQQQLEAIQSDRETLAALQKAIATLGLQKQLSFMSDAQGSLDTKSDTAPITMNMPVAPHP